MMTHHLIIPYCIPSVRRPITLNFPTRVVVSEGAAVYLLPIGMTGVSVGVVPFSLVPLTYEQFETMTGETVANLFGTFPPAASEGKTQEGLSSDVCDFIILCR